MVKPLKAGSTEVTGDPQSPQFRRELRLIPDFPEGYAVISIKRNRSVSISILHSLPEPRQAESFCP